MDRNPYPCPSCGTPTDAAHGVLCADCGALTCPACRHRRGHLVLCDVCAEIRALDDDDSPCPAAPPRNSRLYPGE